LPNLVSSPSPFSLFLSCPTSFLWISPPTNICPLFSLFFYSIALRSPPVFPFLRSTFCVSRSLLPGHSQQFLSSLSPSLSLAALTARRPTTPPPAPGLGPFFASLPEVSQSFLHVSPVFPVLFKLLRRGLFLFCREMIRFGVSYPH